MLENKSTMKAAQDRLFWDASYKYRKILIPLIILLISVGTVFLVKSYISMQIKVKQLSAFEPIYVLSVNRDLNVGDSIRREDLNATLFYKKEYKKINHKENEDSMPEPALVQCRYDQKSGQLSGFDRVVGRVLKVPLLKDSLLRKEHLAEEGAVPGLMNLIEKGHSLLNVEVPQSGFNIFIKPNDYVELYRVSKKLGSKLLASKIKVILVDSLPLGKAPFQVPVNPQAKRNLTLAVPDLLFSKSLKAQKDKELMVTYKNKELLGLTTANQSQPIKSFKQFFQPLTMIKGANKQVIGR